MGSMAIRPSLADAIIIATQAHRFQVDKNGQPYILHSLRVMLRLTTEVERIIGVLHDVPEDTEVDFKLLRVLGFGPDVLDALEYVTKRPEEEDDYEAFIDRIKRGPELAIKVKLADLSDNMDPARRTTDDERTRKRQAKYARALVVLSEELARRTGGGM